MTGDKPKFSNLNKFIFTTISELENKKKLNIDDFISSELIEQVHTQAQSPSYKLQLNNLNNSKISSKGIVKSKSGSKFLMSSGNNNSITNKTPLQHKKNNSINSFSPTNKNINKSKTFNSKKTPTPTPTIPKINNINRSFGIANTQKKLNLKEIKETLSISII